MDLALDLQLVILLAYAFIFVIGFFSLVVVCYLCIAYVEDITQTEHTIRRNYPVIGRGRYIFEKFGVFLRQYFFSMDREEMPFNRAVRSWVYSNSKGEGGTKGFGSTRNSLAPNTFSLVNTLIPVQADHDFEIEPLSFGQGMVENEFASKCIFNISGMSYGALSTPAVRALSLGAGKSGCWMNTGEGGLSSHHLEGNGDLVFQIGTAKYGVRTESGELSELKLKEVAAHEQVKMFEIKLSQGAKPGKGGILPQIKITPEIEQIRGIKAINGPSISPNGHLEIAKVDDLLDLINRVRDVVKKPVGMKLVMGSENVLDGFIENILVRGKEIAPDFITLDSCDGGTGAAPEILMDYTGLHITQSLPALVRKLTEAGLRDRIRLNASGKGVTSGRIARLLCIGADTVSSARGFMFALGCIQALECHKNTCPTGITTHDLKKQKGLHVEQKSVRVANYVKAVHEDLIVLAHSCGLNSPRQFNPENGRITIGDGKSVLASEYYYPALFNTKNTDSNVQHSMPS